MEILLKTAVYKAVIKTKEVYSMIFKMAIKNLFSNKAKTIIMLSLIGMGTFLIILGLGILKFSQEQTKAVCISDFTGDILITGKPENDDVFVELSGANQIVSLTLDRPKMPYLPEMTKIRTKLTGMETVKAFTESTVTPISLLRAVDLSDDWQNPKGSYPPYLHFLGIQPESYKKIFDTIQIYEGEFPQSNNEVFCLLPKSTKEAFEKHFERELKIGDDIVLNSFGNKSKTASVKVTGFFTFAHPDTAISGFGYCNVDTCRNLAGMIMGAKIASEIPESIDLTLSEKSEEDLFADDENMFADTVSVSNKGLTENDVETILGSTELRDALNLPDTEAWNHIAVRLHNALFTQKTVKELNDWFKAENIEAQALLWDKGMVSYAGRIKSTKALLTIVLALLSVVVLIVIMNTLVVSIMERTSEIGTMRAIGAKRSFVKKIFYAESFFMTCSGVVAGTVLALIAGAVFNAFDLRFGTIFGTLFGGYKIKTSISILSILGTAFAMLTAGFIANIYPIRIALKISPLEAINR